jgi:hypothetical protein
MRTTWMLVGTLALCGVAAQPALAQSPAGDWVLDAARSQSVEDALAAARGAAGGGMAMRAGGGGGGGGGGTRVVRRDGPGGGIMGVLQGGQRLGIELAAEQVTIRVDGGAPITLPLSGAATQVTRWEQQVHATARLADGTLTVETTLQSGVVVTEAFNAAADELTVEVRMPLPVMSAGGQPPAQPPVLTLRRVYTPAS